MQSHFAAAILAVWFSRNRPKHKAIYDAHGIPAQVLNSPDIVKH